MKMATDDGNTVHQSGSYVVLLASFMALFFNVGMAYAVGVYHVALMETFSEDPNASLTVWLGSTNFCMFALAGPIGSVIIDFTSCRTCVILSGVLGLVGWSANFIVYDIRWMLITYSLTAGIGTALANTGAIIILGYTHKSKLSIITGVAVSGIALGIFVHPPVCQCLIEEYGVHGAFLISGAIVFNTCVCGMLMTSSPSENERHAKVMSGRPRREATLGLFLCNCTSYWKIVTHKSFMFFLLSSVGYGMGNSTLYVYLSDYLQHRGITSQASVFSVSFTGIGSILSRVLTGVAAHDENIGSGLMFLSLNGMMGIFSLLIPLFTLSSLAVYIYGFLIGLYSGGMWSLFCPLTVDILDIELMTAGFGVVMCACGLGMMTGPPIAGYIFKQTNEYYSVFVFSAMVFFACTVSMFFSILSKGGTLQLRRSKVQKPSDNIDMEELDNMIL